MIFFLYYTLQIFFHLIVIVIILVKQKNLFHFFPEGSMIFFLLHLDGVKYLFNLSKYFLRSFQILCLEQQGHKIVLWLPKLSFKVFAFCFLKFHVVENVQKKKNTDAVIPTLSLFGQSILLFQIYLEVQHKACDCFYIFCVL